ncbi:MAG: DUF2975 domain-containing protein [Clostridia bacterium]|nr:DUF2975 domain-containing protein [Clostridia bacterium]
MTQSNLSKWLRAVIIAAAVCVLLVYLWLLPMTLRDLSLAYYIGAFLFLPALIFLELTGVPILIALGFAWCIAGEIGRDNSFSRRNASYMKRIAALALIDVVYFQVGILFFAFCGFYHPGVFLAVFFLDCVGLAISVCAAALSHLILKAAAIREENDLTV